MSFTSYSFILLFLPLTLVIYHLLHGRLRLQQVMLCVASLAFLVVAGIASLVVLSAFVLANYFVSRTTPPIQRSRRVAFWCLAVFNIGLLVAFKYFVSKALWPLGLSFYTFSQLLYLKSVLLEGRPKAGFLEYLVWILFFGKITQGPIAGYDEIPTISAGSGRLNWDLLADGIVLFVFGMAKKLLLADNLAVIVDNSWNNTSLGLIPAWIGSLSYTFQLYFDFSGYTDMARGVGLMFGIILPLNFNSPYKSSSISEFWRRWHITLGKALTQLVYIPLGGSRKGRGRTLLNLVVVMLVSGFWHGDTWTFVLWGLVNGLIMVIERLIGADKRTSRIQVVITFILTNFLWVPFRAPSLSLASERFISMFNFTDSGISQISSLAMDGIINFPAAIWVAYIALLLALSFVICFACRNSDEVTTTVKGRTGMAILIPLLFMMAFSCIGRPSVFLYQNF